MWHQMGNDDMGAGRRVSPDQPSNPPFPGIRPHLPPNTPRCSESSFPQFRILYKSFIQEQLKKATMGWVPKGEMVIGPGV